MCQKLRFNQTLELPLHNLLYLTLLQTTAQVVQRSTSKSLSTKKTTTTTKKLFDLHDPQCSIDLRGEGAPLLQDILHDDLTSITKHGLSQVHPAWILEAQQDRVCIQPVHSTPLLLSLQSYQLVLDEHTERLLHLRREKK